jgi:hypothetical protein
VIYKNKNKSEKEKALAENFERDVEHGNGKQN